MRKNSLARQARRAYDQAELTRICTLREDRFGRAFGMETIRIPTGRKASRWYDDERPEDYYHFRDNNSAVLAVAHLDTVVRQKGRTPHFRNTERGPLITSGALDDRLGAYVILGLLPKLGVTCDWLLTVGEESAASTAEHFDPRGKKYDWVIEFDRGGTDVVMYQYEDNASMRLVEAAGAETGWGSFSDIAYLEQLGVKAFNWGVGYRGNYHSEAGYAYLNDTFSMVAKYLRFHEQNAGTRLPHEPKPASRSYGGSGSYDRYDKYDDDYYGKCASCGEENAVDSVTWYCEFCGICQDCGATNPEVAADWNDPDANICQCYAPKQRGGTSDPDDRDWRAMDWDEYCELRPAAADDAALKDAWQKAQDKDGKGTLVPARRSPSIAPPWSESRPSYGLGVPTGRKTASQQGGKPWNRELSPGPALTAGERADAVTTLRALAGKPSAVNPPAVFPDADLGWHEAASKGIAYGLPVVAHKPGQAWARICLRCAARWPHPVGSTNIHPESDCPGCDRCLAANAGRNIDVLHVIPAHLAGESDACGLCRELNTGPNAAGSALREIAATLTSDCQPEMSAGESARLTEIDR